ncbi:MAG: hypothetical protein ABEH86_06700 [Haloarcula sp.]
MALQIGSALQEAGHRLLSRTGALLLGAFLVLMIGFQTLFNSIFAAAYARLGSGEIASALPLTVDIPIAVAGAGLAVGMVVSLYLTIVTFRTFVTGTRDRFPEGAFTRNIPRAMVNSLIGGLVYGLLMFIGSLLFVIPGIFAYVVFIFTMPYIVVADQNFIAAFKESYRLTEGNRLALFGLLVIVIAASGFIGGIAGLVGALALSPPASQLVTVVIQAPVSLYSTAVIAVAFEQLWDADEMPPSTPSEAGTPTTA